MVNKADKNPGTVSGESMWVEKKKKKKGEDPVSKRFLWKEISEAEACLKSLRNTKVGRVTAKVNGKESRKLDRKSEKICRTSGPS